MWSCAFRPPLQLCFVLRNSRPRPDSRLAKVKVWNYWTADGVSTGRWVGARVQQRVATCFLGLRVEGPGRSSPWVPLSLLGPSHLPPSEPWTEPPGRGGDVI